MKTIILILLLCPLFSEAKDLLTFQEFRLLSAKQKVEVLTAYKDFVQELSNSQDSTDSDELTTFSSMRLFSEAYAAEKFNCFFAGWPSLKKVVVVKGVKKTFCTSPRSSKSKVCKSEQMLCQPTLFGVNLCVDAGTREQKNSVFSQCQIKFNQSGKSLAALADEVSKPGQEHASDELFALVHDVCSSGFQSKTGMCRNLKSRVAQIIGKTTPEKTEVKATSPVTEEAQVQAELVDAVKTVTQGTEQVEEMNKSQAVVTDCPAEAEVQTKPEVFVNHESSEPIDQSKSTPDDYCAGTEDGSVKDRYSASLYDDRENDVSVNVVYQDPDHKLARQIPGGYNLYANKLGAATQSLMIGETRPEAIYARRDFSNSFLGRGKENSFEVTDSPIRENYDKQENLVERFVSTDMRITQYAFFPRRVVPSVKKSGDEVIMKMTTGEEIKLDAKTGKVIGGVVKEVPATNRVDHRVDSKGRKNVRTYLDNEIAYEGKALYIQTVLHSNLNEKEPGSIVPVRAQVNGKLQECKLKSEDLWETKTGYYLPETDKKHDRSQWKCTKFKFEKDEELYGLIKKTCPEFQFPELVK